MKKFIKGLILFMVPVLALLFLSKFDNIDKSSSRNPNIISLQNKSYFDSLDILFVGGSYCYSGVYPKMFDSIGIKTFNLGIATAGPYFYELIVNDYLSSIKKKPKSIYIDISPMTFSSIIDNFAAYPVHRYLKKPISNETLVIKYGLYNKYFDLIKKSIEKGVKNLLKNNEGYKNDNFFKLKGFLLCNDVNSPKIEREIEHLFTPLKKEKFNSEKADYLLKFSEKLKNSGINIVYFELPTNKLENYYTPEYLSDYNKFKQKVKSKYLFFDNKLKLENKYFRNLDHINTQGALIYTKTLIQEIKTLNK